MASRAIGRRLMRHGVFLVLLALLTGAVIPVAANPRQALAAHTGGLMLGLLVAVIGLLWHRLRLSGRGMATAYWAVLFGAYVNWAGNLLAACFGTSELTPLAGQGFENAAPWQEAVVNAALGSSSVAILIGVAVVLYGVRGADPEP